MINFLIYYNRHLLIINILFYVLNYFKIFKSNLFTCLLLTFIIIGINELELKNQRIFYLNIGVKIWLLWLFTFIINLIIFLVWENLL